MALAKKKNISSLSELTELIKSILSKTTKTSKLINELTTVVNHKDVLFYTWKILLRTLNVNNDSSEIFMLNVLELLEKIPINKLICKEHQDNEVLGLNKGSQKFTLNVVLLKKCERKVWELLINREMNYVIHKKLLLVLIEFYLSKLENPIFLTDFFMASMNMKGVVKILALQGVATLMQKHNIEYPNIYGKLYGLFEPRIFHSKHKSRLFYLANIFLSSTHLPGILVASFAKRASRLSLTCSTPDILIILRFIGNLLIRHSGLVKMIHHPNILEVPEDPFLENESDPMKTQASSSSLWEISLLNNHCQPSISSAAKFIHFKLPSLEFDLAEVLDNSYEKMFEVECKNTKKIKPSVTFQRPQETIEKLTDDRVYKLWFLTNVLEILIENGADVNIMDKRRATPLHRAASKGDSATVLLLLNLGKSINVNVKDAYGNTPLHLACEDNNGEVAELLVQHGALTEIKNKEEKSPLELTSFPLQKRLKSVISEMNK